MDIYQSKKYQDGFNFVQKAITQRKLRAKRTMRYMKSFCSYTILYSNMQVLSWKTVCITIKFTMNLCRICETVENYVEELYTLFLSTCSSLGETEGPQHRL